jgi:hypothetical protein
MPWRLARTRLGVVADCTAHEIVAVLSHRTLTEAQCSTIEADRGRMAATAMDKIVQTGSGRLQDFPACHRKPQVITLI